MSEENNSNANQPDRKKRNYRHFGPADTAGKPDAAKNSSQERSARNVSNQKKSANQQPAGSTSDDTARSGSQSSRSRRKPRTKNSRSRNPQQRPSGNQRNSLNDDARGVSRKNEPQRKNQPDQSNQTDQIKNNIKANHDRQPDSERRRLSNQLDQQSGSKENTSGKRLQRDQGSQDRNTVQKRSDFRRSEVNRKSASARQDRWQSRIKAEETFEDIKKDNERLEKEIWLEIASIHTIKLD